VSRRVWILGVFGGLALGAAAHAAESDDLNLVGTVPPILDIQVSPTAAANGLDLSLVQADLKVADVLTQSNTPGGYLVTVTSANVGSGDCTGPCFYSDTADDSLTYTLSEGTTALTFASETATFAQSSQRTTAGGDSYVVNLSYDGSTTNLATATDYRETLTFTIALN